MQLPISISNATPADYLLRLPFPALRLTGKNKPKRWIEMFLQQGES